MNDHSKAVEVSAGTQLRLPVQAAPVDRTLAGVAALAASAGVEASAWWDKLIPIGKNILESFL